MAHGALGARLSCLLELNVIYTAERQEQRYSRRGELKQEGESAVICASVSGM